MTDVIETEQDTAPVETPAALPSDTPIGTAPASADSDLDTLLAEYETATSKQSEPEPAADNTEPLSNEELDKFVAEFSGPSADPQDYRS